MQRQLISPIRMLLLCSVLSCTTIALADEAVTSQSVTQKVEVKVQSSTTQDGDAEPQTSVSGRIVIVGPDGERREYNLDDELPGDLKLNLNNITNGIMISPDKTQTDDDKPRYVIGVVCQPVDKVLRSHLKLKGTGLVISRLSHDMPAAKAGLEEGDILIGVGDKEFSHIKDLVTAVAECNGAPLTFRRIHEGQVSDVVVTPIESTDLAKSHLMESARELLYGKNNGVMIQSFGPGIQLDSAEDFEEKFAELLANARKNARMASANAQVATENGGMEKLKQQIEQNRAELIELKKQLKASESGQ
jgi:membrane-associated protease RseP (regulator of RpoE activity)